MNYLLWSPNLSSSPEFKHHLGTSNLSQLIVDNIKTRFLLQEKGSYSIAFPGVFQTGIIFQGTDLSYIIPSNNFYTDRLIRKKDISVNLLTKELATVDLKTHNFVYGQVVDKLKSLKIKISDSNCLYFLAFFYKDDTVNMSYVSYQQDIYLIGSSTVIKEHYFKSLWPDSADYRSTDFITINNPDPTYKYFYLICAAFVELAAKMQVQIEIDRTNLFKQEETETGTDTPSNVDPDSIPTDTPSNVDPDSTPTSTPSNVDPDSTPTSTPSPKDLTKEEIEINEEVKQKSSEEINSLTEEEVNSYLENVVQTFEEKKKEDIINLEEISILKPNTQLGPTKEKIIFKTVKAEISKNYQESFLNQNL